MIFFLHWRHGGLSYVRYAGVDGCLLRLETAWKPIAGCGTIDSSEICMPDGKSVWANARPEMIEWILERCGLDWGAA